MGNCSTCNGNTRQSFLETIDMAGTVTTEKCVQDAKAAIA